MGPCCKNGICGYGQRHILAHKGQSMEGLLALGPLALESLLSCLPHSPSPPLCGIVDPPINVHLPCLFLSLFIHLHVLLFHLFSFPSLTIL